jgi:hypothetical protein
MTPTLAHFQDAYRATRLEPAVGRVYRYTRARATPTAVPAPWRALLAYHGQSAAVRYGDDSHPALLEALGRCGYEVSARVAAVVRRRGSRGLPFHAGAARRAGVPAGD